MSVMKHVETLDCSAFHSPLPTFSVALQRKWPRVIFGRSLKEKALKSISTLKGSAVKETARQLLSTATSLGVLSEQEMENECSRIGLSASGCLTARINFSALPAYLRYIVVASLHKSCGKAQRKELVPSALADFLFRSFAMEKFRTWAESLPRDGPQYLPLALERMETDSAEWNRIQKQLVTTGIIPGVEVFQWWSFIMRRHALGSQREAFGLVLDMISKYTIGGKDDSMIGYMLHSMQNSASSSSSLSSSSSASSSSASSSSSFSSSFSSS